MTPIPSLYDLPPWHPGILVVLHIQCKRCRASAPLPKPIRHTEACMRRMVKDEERSREGKG